MGATDNRLNVQQNSNRRKIFKAIIFQLLLYSSLLCLFFSLSLLRWKWNFGPDLLPSLLHAKKTLLTKRQRKIVIHIRIILIFWRFLLSDVLLQPLVFTDIETNWILPCEVSWAHQTTLFRFCCVFETPMIMSLINLFFQRASSSVVLDMVSKTSPQPVVCHRSNLLADLRRAFDRSTTYPITTISILSRSFWDAIE